MPIISIYIILSRYLVIESTLVLVRVAMYRAEQPSTPAGESWNTQHLLIPTDMNIKKTIKLSSSFRLPGATSL